METNIKMTDRFKKKIEEEMKNLPEELQSAIRSVDWPRIAEGIAGKHLLGADEVENLQLEIFLVLLGLRSIEFLSTNIENQVVIPKEDAEIIAREAVMKIFNPILNEYQKIVKNKTSGKKADWQQNLNFVLSGGNYAELVREPKKVEQKGEQPQRVEDLRNKFTI